MFESESLNYLVVAILFYAMIEIMHYQSKSKMKWYERLLISCVWPLAWIVGSVAFLYFMIERLKDYVDQQLEK